MKKFSLFALLFIILLNGCTNQKNKVSPNDISRFPSIPLEIAVVGKNKYPEITNIKYVQKDLSDIVSTLGQSFDGLIISKEDFEEASKTESKNYFKTIKSPVFFIETQDILVDVFHDEKLSLDHVDLDGSGPYVSGFVSTEYGFNQWYLYLPNDPTSKDKGISMLLKIFDIIEKHKKNNM